MSGPVLAFDMSRTKGAKITRKAEAAPEGTAALGVVPANSPAPGARQDDRFSARAVARADLSAIYAALLGVDVSRGDLLERMARDGGDKVTPEIISAALTDAGLMTRITAPRTLRPSLWPALAEMVSGQVILVLEQTADAVIVYDTTCPANRAEVPMAE